MVCIDVIGIQSKTLMPSHSKKILINAFSLKEGGGQTHLIKIIEYLKVSRDFSVTILASKKSNFNFNRDDIELINIKWPLHNPIFRFFWEVLFLPSLLKKLKINLLFCPGGIISNKVPKNVKSVTMFRNMSPFDKKIIKETPLNKGKIRNLIIKRLMLQSMLKADLVIFISEFAKGIIYESLNKRIKKGVLINHGVDFNHIKEFEDISHIANFPFILYPSSIDRYKSQLEVIEAYFKIQKKMHLPNLLLVGSVDQNPKYVELVKKSIKEKKLERKIYLIGKVDFKYMPALYKKSDFIIFASKTENCPNILLEAMCSSKMILCSNFQPMPEFAEDSVIYFNPENSGDLAEKLEIILTNEDLINLYSKKAKKKSQVYSWEKTSDKTWKALNSVL